MSDPHHESSPAPPAEMEVPAEIRRRTSSGSHHATGCLFAAVVILLPALVYFGFFAVLVIDELVLKTRYLREENLPPGAFEAIVVIYYPLILLTRWALGLN